MPYSDIAKGGTIGALLLILAYLVNWFIQKDKARDEAVIKSNAEHQDFIKSIITDSKTREENLIKNHKEERELLMQHLNKYDENLDKYNDTLKGMSMYLKSIPKMQEDINELKAKIC